MKALIVDDSTTMRRILVKTLAAIGIEDVDHASDGKQAVAKITAGNYDFVLMDWNMPNMSGLEALQNVRDAGNMTPIIMVTTEGEKRNVVEALKAGANNYVIKPFEKETLQAKVQQTLQRIGKG